MQMRIDFPGPKSDLTLGVVLRGFSIVAAPWEGTVEDAVAYLQQAGIEVRVEPGTGLVFPVRELGSFTKLPTQVRIEPLGGIAPLVHLAVSRPKAPATLTLTDTLRLSWFDGTTRCEYQLDSEAAAALAVSELPFVATDEAWNLVGSLAGVPVSLGRAQLNHDNFIEIVTSKPQQLEAANLPGLFRIDDTHYGISLAYAHCVDAVDGLSWAVTPRATHRPPAVSDAVDTLLVPHLQSDLRELLQKLTTLGGQVLVYAPGLGRRILALAALESLDALPALVVCPPWALWIWQRNADLLGKTVSLTNNDADIRLVTYLDLALGARLGGYGSVVFDDFGTADATGQRARKALSGLAVLDAVRIGITSTWPQDPEEACVLLDLVRPGEFSFGDEPLARRYPLAPVRRAEEHAQAYIMRRADADPSVLSQVRRHETTLVEALPGQIGALETLGGQPPHQKLQAAIDITSAGTSGQLSPKLAAVSQIVNPAVSLRRKVAVVTRSTRAAALLRATLAALRPAFTDREVPDAQLVVVVWDEKLPDLRDFDDVIFMEYPWSVTMIDSSIGPAVTTNGPRHTTVLHAPGTWDDRLAIYAARQRELGANTGVGPNEADVEYLLARRW